MVSSMAPRGHDGADQTGRQEVRRAYILVIPMVWTRKTAQLQTRLTKAAPWIATDIVSLLSISHHTEGASEGDSRRRAGQRQKKKSCAAESSVAKDKSDPRSGAKTCGALNMPSHEDRDLLDVQRLLTATPESARNYVTRKATRGIAARVCRPRTTGLSVWPSGM